jgi:hypothetical protein
MPAWFVNNPEVPTKFTARGTRSKSLYEFGPLPVRVDDPMDAERFRKETVTIDNQVVLRLLETSAAGKPLDHQFQAPDLTYVPKSTSNYRPRGPVQPAPAPRAAPRSPAYARVTGELPAGTKAADPERSDSPVVEVDIDAEERALEQRVIRRKNSLKAPTS